MSNPFKFKAPKMKLTNALNPSHHETGIGGPIKLKHISKMGVPKITQPIEESKSERSIRKFKNIMRFLKQR